MIEAEAPGNCRKGPVSAGAPAVPRRLPRADCPGRSAGVRNPGGLKRSSLAGNHAVPLRGAGISPRARRDARHHGTETGGGVLANRPGSSKRSWTPQRCDRICLAGRYVCIGESSLCQVDGVFADALLRMHMEELTPSIPHRKRRRSHGSLRRVNRPSLKKNHSDGWLSSSSCPDVSMVREMTENPPAWPRSSGISRNEDRPKRQCGK